MKQWKMIGYPKKKTKKARRTHPQSILHRKDGTCYLCCGLDHDYRIHKDLEEHHAFPGNPGRQTSETFGFKVYLCQQHHRIGSAAVHNDPEMLRLIQRDVQEEYEQTHTREEWMSIMGKNYL